MINQLMHAIARPVKRMKHEYVILLIYQIEQPTIVVSDNNY